jgi:hypothetical protein
MDSIQPITPRIPTLPAVEPTGHRVDPEQQKREQERREQKRREPERDAEPSEEDDGLPHVDVSV